MMLATEADLLQLSPPSSLGGGLCGAMGHSSNTYTPGMGNSSSSVLNGSGITNGSAGPTYRAKPGHCNGTVNTTGGNASGEMSFTSIPNSFMHLPVSTHTSMASTQHMTPSSHVTNCDNIVMSDGNDSDHVPPLLLSVTSPKIRKSFGSRISSQIGRGSPPTKTIGGMSGDCSAEMEPTTYLPGDTVDGIPTLSPPPYKSSSTTGSNSSVTGHDARESDRGKLTSYSVVKRGAGGFESSSLQRINQNEKQMMSPTEALIALPKSGNSILQAKHSSSITNRTNSSTSMGSIGGSRPGGGITNISTMDREIGLAHHRQMVGTIGGNKVIFEESSETAPTTSANNTNNKMSSSTTGSVPIATPAAPQPRGTGGKSLVANSKAVNGILRKGSIPGNEIVSPPLETRESNDRKGGGDRDRDTTSKRSRKTRDGGNGERSNHKSKSGKNKSNSAKLGSLNESNNSEKAQETDGEKSRGGGGGNRSRSNSTKSSSKAEKQQEKIQKDLALTRDLPWCGCWGNGCL